jgi:hypothetical protein
METHALALLVLAASNAGHTAESPSTGLGLGIIVAIIVGAILLFAAIFAVFVRTTRASRGGVQPPPSERGTRHEPPVERIERRS